MGRTRSRAKPTASTAGRRAATAKQPPPSPPKEPPVDEAASAAESDESTKTACEVLSDEEVWSEINEFRQRKVTLGGTLTRPIKEYRKEDVPLAPPNSTSSRSVESSLPPPSEHNPEDYRKLYMAMEHDYWRGELRGWEYFLRWIQHDWERRNKAAGGTVPPPPPITDFDQLELHTQYLDYVRRRVRVREENPQFPSGWVFMVDMTLQEHLAAVERQVAAMQRERGLDEDAREEAGPVAPGAAGEGKGKAKRKRGDDDAAQADDVLTLKRAKPDKASQPSEPGPSSRKARAAKDAVVQDVPKARSKGPSTGKRGRGKGKKNVKETEKEKEKAPTTKKRQKKPPNAAPTQPLRRSARIAARAVKD